MNIKKTRKDRCLGKPFNFLRSAV